jgi:putative peptide zinc metalloprotease protein
MSRSLRALTILLLAVLIGAAPIGERAAVHAAGGDNVAIAINTRDGSSVFRFSFSIRRALKGVVDSRNLAAAYASCSDCSTTAVAFQVVLASGEVLVVTAENLAIAINEECEGCETLAVAHQWIVGSDGLVRFTPEGQRAINEIRRQLLALYRTDLTLEEQLAVIEEAAQQLTEVLANELVEVGPAPSAKADRTETEDREGPAEPSADDGDDTAADPASSRDSWEGPEPSDSTAAQDQEADEPAAAPGSTDGDGDGGIDEPTDAEDPSVEDATEEAPAAQQDADPSDAETGAAEEEAATGSVEPDEADEEEAADPPADSEEAVLQDEDEDEPASTDDETDG